MTVAPATKPALDRQRVRQDAFIVQKYGFKTAVLFVRFIGWNGYEESGNTAVTTVFTEGTAVLPRDGENFTVMPWER